MTRWRQLNTIGGYVVFGLPSLLAIPALMATIARFGLWATLTSAALPVIAVAIPLLLWARYTRHRPVWKIARVTWAALALVSLTLIAASPIWFWSAPVLAVLLSEVLRAGVASLSPGRDRRGAPRMNPAAPRGGTP